MPGGGGWGGGAGPRSAELPAAAEGDPAAQLPEIIAAVRLLVQSGVARSPSLPLSLSLSLSHPHSRPLSHLKTQANKDSLVGEYLAS